MGEVTNLAPTEQIKAVRFMGERAYVVTFRVVDPLFAIDLSDPTTPVVRGALKIPGFSDYLHPVGGDYLLGIGRDADEITGRLGPFQITLFDVSDLDRPTVAGQVTFEGAAWVRSEAWIDHHAVAYFEESGVLAVPLVWREEVTKQGNDGLSYQSYKQHQATWTFEVKTNGKASLKATGKIEHPKPPAPGFVPRDSLVITTLPFMTDVWFPPQRFTPQPMQRALRINDALVTVSKDWLQVHKLSNPKQQLGEIHYGPPVANDWFTIDEDSGPHAFDVLANDPPTATGESTNILAVNDMIGGTAVVSGDGRSVVFTPDENFFGTASFTYTVVAPFLGEVAARVAVNVRGTPDDPVAVDDTFALNVSSQTVELDLLANDLNPDFRLLPYYFVQVTDFARQFQPAPAKAGLVIAEVGPTLSGAVVGVSDQGQVAYTPAEDFIGIDTFDYTIRDQLGRTDTATVTVYIGVQPPSEQPTSNGPPTTERKAFEEPRELKSLGLIGIASLLDTDRESFFATFDGRGLLRGKPAPVSTHFDLGWVTPSSQWVNLLDRAYSDQSDWRLDSNETVTHDSDSHAASTASFNAEELTTPVKPSVGGIRQSFHG